MTAFADGTDCSPARLAATRAGLHRVAEHVLAAARYVGPHDGPPPGDPAFRNAPFGAALTFRQIGTVAEAAAFFRDGRVRAQAATLIDMRRTS